MNERFREIDSDSDFGRGRKANCAYWDMMS